MNKISVLTKGLIGKICWGVELDRQLGLTMSFGKPDLKIREPRNPRPMGKQVFNRSSFRRVNVRGEWWLWLFYAYWKITIPNVLTATKSSSLRSKRKAMGLLDGQRLESIHTNAETGYTEFRFDLGATLTARREHKDDNDIWSLALPNGYYLDVRGDGTYTYAHGMIPGKELLPKSLKASGKRTSIKE